MVGSRGIYFVNGERHQPTVWRSQRGGQSLMVSSDYLCSLGKAMSFLGKTGGPQIRRESSERMCLLFSSPTELARSTSKEERWLKCSPSSMTKAKQAEVAVCKRMIQQWTSGFTWINWRVKTRIGEYG